MTITLDQLMASLAAMPARATHRGRGVTAKHVDIATARAKADALASWTRYGQGESGSAGTMRGRMSRDRSKVEGYMMADGDGAFQSEHGTHSRAPDPVMHRNAEAQVDAWADGMSEMLADLL